MTKRHEKEKDIKPYTAKPEKCAEQLIYLGKSLKKLRKKEWNSSIMCYGSYRCLKT